MQTERSDPDAVLLEPILKTTRRFYITVVVLATFMGLGITAWIYQITHGLGVTGLNRPVFWGVYITNFVFFIGVSHAGTLISAILRICRAEWRRPITRAAEVITVVVLFIGAFNVIADIGRPDRALHVLRHGRFQSPLLWDVCSISIYLTASTIYLYLPLIPDIAYLRDHTDKHPRLYRILALGWTGTKRQQRRLLTAISIMAVVVIPIAVSVHTVVSYVFSMTVQPMWHSAIFGPYFVVGAMFSGIASIIIVMAVLRWIYGLKDYLKPVHFSNLGILLLVMTLLWFYFTFCEYLTTHYGGELSHLEVYRSKVTGEFSAMFWAMVFFCLVVPFGLLCNRRTRTIAGTVVASISVNIGMWLERYTIVVPTLYHPRLPHEGASYFPSLVEIAITLGCFAAFTLGYALFSKLFPIVSIWEIQEGREEEAKRAGRFHRRRRPRSAPGPRSVREAALR